MIRKNELADFSVILLAGGASSRIGSPKGLIPYRGKLWLESQLETLNTLGLAGSIVVLGYQAEEYFKAISALKNSAVVNQHPEDGPFSSLQAGAEVALRSEIKGAFVLPQDVPCASAEVFLALAHSMKTGVDAVIPRLHQRGGHPVLLSSSFLRKLLKLSRQSRLDEELRKFSGPSVIHCEVQDSKIQMNLNTAEDFEKFIG